MFGEFVNSPKAIPWLEFLNPPPRWRIYKCKCQRGQNSQGYLRLFQVAWIWNSSKKKKKHCIFKCQGDKPSHRVYEFPTSQIPIRNFVKEIDPKRHLTQKKMLLDWLNVINWSSITFFYWMIIGKSYLHYFHNFMLL